MIVSKETNLFFILFSLFLVYCIFALCYVNVHKDEKLQDWIMARNNSSKNQQNDMIICEALLERWNPEIPALIIDSKFLSNIIKERCYHDPSQPIKIGVDAKYRKDDFFVNDKRFDVIYYTVNGSKDFLDFDVDDRRIIPINFVTEYIGNFEIPTDVKQFIAFWERSKFMNCVGLRVLRNESEKVVLAAQKSTEVLAGLRDELIDNGMFPFLNDETLFGWYRECSWIPHTFNMNLAVFHKDYNPEYLKKLENQETEFSIVRRSGMVEKSFEMTLVPKGSTFPRIDISLIYDGDENGTITHSYVSGLADGRTKYKYFYSVHDPWCAAELHDHIFWVTCSPRLL
ncbi:hypothetical protein CAEBREN_10497 [Caenorhabditis brenneri]|uniref:W02B3.4-like N-terminal domain-containing protein n=1 Tax=Caenorhabditis brenneri TaxID=135651 RepID=G0MRN4_CAEBE|nr:hypothetical protein CAEBREN_10497 [Caenorhabditis brenneri]